MNNDQSMSDISCDELVLVEGGNAAAFFCGVGIGVTVLLGIASMGAGAVVAGSYTAPLCVMAFA